MLPLLLLPLPSFLPFLPLQPQIRAARRRFLSLLHTDTIWELELFLKKCSNYKFNCKWAAWKLRRGRRENNFPHLAPIFRADIFPLYGTAPVRVCMFEDLTLKYLSIIYLSRTLTEDKMMKLGFFRNQSPGMVDSGSNTITLISRFWPENFQNSFSALHYNRLNSSTQLYNISFALFH